MRIEFANRLRGIAALSVVICHLFGVFWLNNNIVSDILNVPHTEIHASSFTYFFYHFRYFDYGPFGVALFFLISGFVIPLSFEKQSSLQFLISRFFRIWPTYLAGFSITLISFKIASMYFASIFPFSFPTIISNLFLLNEMLGAPTMDNLNWTLEIEINFYLLIAIFALFIKQKPLIFILLSSAIFTALNVTGVWLNFLPHHFLTPLIACRHSFVMITFMFIGVVFHLHYRKKFNLITAVFTIGYLLTVFLMQAWNNPSTSNISQTITINYSLAFIVFSLGYILNRTNISALLLKNETIRFSYSLLKPVINISNYIINKLADISYPLYVVHAIFGFVYLRICLDNTHNPYFSILSCLFFVFLLAFILHKFIELPSNSFGKKIANKLSKESRVSDALLPVTNFSINAQQES